jgi:hypothetical protein
VRVSGMCRGGVDGGRALSDSRRLPAGLVSSSEAFLHVRMKVVPVLGIVGQRLLVMT